MPAPAPIAFVGPGRLYLTLAAGTESEHICELTGVKLVASADILRVKTGCPGGVSRVTEASYDLQVGYVQDVSAATTLTRQLIGKHGDTVPFLFVPDGTTKAEISDAHPAYSGTCTLVAAAVGALATEIAVADATFPAQDIVEVTVPPVPLAA